LLVSENCVYKKEDQGDPPKSDRYFKEESQYFIKETQKSVGEHILKHKGRNINLFPFISADTLHRNPNSLRFKKIN
jgi:hypothetical protein